MSSTGFYHKDFYQAPNAFRFMLRALSPKKGFSGLNAIPTISKSWKSFEAHPKSLIDFSQQTGLPVEKELHPLYLHTSSFRLPMAILTHTAYPLPIWKSLQIRNVIVQSKPIASNKIIDFHAEIASQQIVQKGVEVDLRCYVGPSDKSDWESVTTFYVRGKYGQQSTDWESSKFLIPETIHSRWKFPEEGGRVFGKLTGDYNGIHFVNLYARLMGFKKALSHPQRAVGLALSRIYDKDEMIQTPFKLETWIKGPVFYGSQVTFKVENLEEGKNFSIFVDDDQRPAINGRITGGTINS